MRGTTCTATWRKRGKSYQVTVRPVGAPPFTRTEKTKAAAGALAEHFTRLGLRGTDVAEARRLAEQRQATAPVQWPTLRVALPEFVQLMADQGEWQGSTPARYLARLRHDVFDYALKDGRTLGDLRVDELTERMLGDLLDAIRTGAGARSMAVREQIRCPLKRFYTWLGKRQGFTGPNPAAALRDYMGKAPSKRQRKTRPYAYFRRDEAPRLFAAAREHSPRHRAMIGCMMLAGMRYGEAAALEKADILWDKGAIFLQRAWCEETGRVGTLKNHLNRYVPMPRELAAILREHLEVVELEAMRFAWINEQRRLVFPGQRGTVIRHSTFLEHVWQPLLRRAGLPHRNIHSLRHTFATWALEGDPSRGIPAENILRVRDWMGHSSVEETERYAHVNAMGATQTLDAMSDLVRS